MQGLGQSMPGLAFLDAEATGQQAERQAKHHAGQHLDAETADEAAGGGRRLRHGSFLLAFDGDQPPFNSQNTDSPVATRHAELRNWNFLLAHIGAAVEPVFVRRGASQT